MILVRRIGSVPESLEPRREGDVNPVGLGQRLTQQLCQLLVFTTAHPVVIEQSRHCSII